MNNGSHIPHYKTLDIIKFYDQVYEFSSRYLIFVVAGFLGIIAVLIIWIWEPNNTLPIVSSGTGTNDSFVQETGLIYPINYFAGKLISFDGENKIYGLGGPIWSTQQLSGSRLWNSIDNIVQYNGVILPRQISRSARVPQFTHDRYSEEIVKLFLEGIGSSQVDTGSIQSLLSKTTKQPLSDTIFDTFHIKCTKRKLFITQFCDLKLHNSIPTWSQYDLSLAGEEVATVADYIFHTSTNKDNQNAFCNAMLKQYRYSGNTTIAKSMELCSEEAKNEVTYISYMIAINEEIKNNKFTNKVYPNPSINQYKLMSLYQYLMYKIKGAEYIDKQDDIILSTYVSYITKLASKNAITQPYGDIVTIFHRNYLMPWLNDRDVYASISQKEITNQLIETSNLIINGDESKNITSITKNSRLQSVDFLRSQGIYDNIDNSTGSQESTNLTYSGSTTTKQDDVTTGAIASNTTTTGSTQPSTTPTTSVRDSLNTLISTILDVEPTSFNQKGNIIIIQYPYKGLSRFAAVDLSKKGETQIYFDSPNSGATKITHPKVIFNISDKELIMAIMDNYLRNNPGKQ